MMANFSFPINWNQTVSNHDPGVLLLSSLILLTNSFGVIANTVILIATAMYPPLRASSSILLMAHSVFLDILISGITHPVAAILTMLGPGHVLPSWFCSAYPMFTYAFYIVGTWANTMLALQRLTAIAAPHSFPLLQRRSAVIGMYLLPWVVSYFLNLLPALNLAGITMRRIPFSGTCLIMSQSGHVDRLMIFTVPAVFVPAVVKGFCYAIVLTRSVGQLHDEEQRTNNLRRIAANRRRLDVSRALFLCYLWHCIALFPTVLFANFLPNVYVNHVALQCALRWLTATNGALNPIFLCVSSKMFLHGVKSVLRLCCSGSFLDDGGSFNNVHPVSDFLGVRPGSKSNTISRMV